MFQKIFQGRQLQTRGCLPYFFHAANFKKFLQGGAKVTIKKCLHSKWATTFAALASLCSPSESSQGISERYNLVCKQHMVVLKDY